MDTNTKKIIILLTVSLILLLSISLIIHFFSNRTKNLNLIIPIGDSESEINLIYANSKKALNSSHPKVFFHKDDLIGILFPDKNKIKFYNSQANLIKELELPDFDDYRITGIDSNYEKIILLRLLDFNYSNILFNNDADIQTDQEFIKIELFNDVNNTSESISYNENSLSISENLQVYDVKFLRANSKLFTTGENIFELKGNNIISSNENIFSFTTDQINQSDLIIGEIIEIESDVACEELLKSDDSSICFDRNNNSTNSELLSRNFINDYTLYVSNESIVNKYEKVIDIDVDRNKNKVVFIYLNEEETDFVVKEIKL